MVAISEAAAAFLSVRLTEAEAPNDVAIRLFLVTREDSGNGRTQSIPVEGEVKLLRMRLDKVRPNDATFDREGRTLLVFNKRMSELLADRTLDVEDTDEGPKLALH